MDDGVICLRRGGFYVALQCLNTATVLPHFCPEHQGLNSLRRLFIDELDVRWTKRSKNLSDIF